MAFFSIPAAGGTTAVSSDAIDPRVKRTLGLGLEEHASGAVQLGPISVGGSYHKAVGAEVG